MISLLFLLYTVNAISPYDIKNKSNFNKYINDPDNILTSGDYNTIYNLIGPKSVFSKTLYNCNSDSKSSKSSLNPYHISVLIVKQMDTIHDASSYATAAFNSIGIGNQNCGNGLLIFIAVTEKELVILPGTGLAEKVFDDENKDKIINKMIPFLKNYNYGDSLIEGTKESIQIIKNYYNTFNNFYEQYCYIALWIFVFIIV